jgi:HTH-type transcriptional regulator, sugar sensing transcriptional regulator
MSLNELLEQLGLGYKEDDVYLALLELGAAGVNEIAIKANIKRTTTYDVLSSLGKKGLIGQTQKGKKRLFFAEEPEKLNKLLSEKKQRLEEMMPILKSLYNTAGSKPKIRYYEGKEGLKDVYRDTLNYKGGLVAFVTENIIRQLGQSFADEYLERRKKAGITVRVIGPANEEIIAYQKTDHAFLKETRVVPADSFPFSIEMNIYGNKLAFMSFKEEMGIIIESNEVAKNMRLLFELAWQGANTYKPAA